MAQSNRYGFRAYTLSIGSKNRWKKPESLAELGPAYVKHVFTLLNLAQGEILRYTPNLEAENNLVAEPPSKLGEPVMVIDRVEQHEKMIRCEVVKGNLGDHDELVGEGVEAITDKAAGRRYRIDIYFPTDGERGMIVAETCVRYTPVGLFLNWVAWFDRQRALKVAESLQEGGKEGSSAEGVEENYDNEKNWRKFRVRQISDAKYLRSLIREANKVSVGLSQANSFTDRGRPRELQRRLEILDIGEGMHESIAKEVLSWLEGSKDGALQRMMDILNLKKDSLAEDGLDFNNLSVRLEGTQTLSLTPESIRDLFTYSLAENLRLEDLEWIRRTRPKIFELAELENVTLDL